MLFNMINIPFFILVKINNNPELSKKTEWMTFSKDYPFGFASNIGCVTF